MTSPVVLESLRMRLSNVLMGPACASISFVLPTLTLRPGGYTVIGMSLAVGHAPGPRPLDRRTMQVRVSSNLPANVGASYDGHTNTITVPRPDFGSGADECMSVVHEATHAVFDYQRIRVTAYVEEAAAFIAGALYHRFVHGVPFGNGPFGAAETIAAAITAPQRIGGPPNNVVSSAQLEPLLRAIRASPTYAFLREERRGYGYPQTGGAI